MTFLQWSEWFLTASIVVSVVVYRGLCGGLCGGYYILSIDNLPVH